MREDDDDEDGDVVTKISDSTDSPPANRLPDVVAVLLELVVVTGTGEDDNVVDEILGRVVLECDEEITVADSVRRLPDWGILLLSMSEVVWSAEILVVCSFIEQQTPKRNPSAQVPSRIPSCLIHSQENIQVPGTSLPSR